MSALAFSLIRNQCGNNTPTGSGITGPTTSTNGGIPIWSNLTGSALANSNFVISGNTITSLEDTIEIEANSLILNGATSFSNSVVGGARLNVIQNTTGNATNITIATVGAWYQFTNGGTANLPAASTLSGGESWTLQNTSATALTILPNGSDSILGQTVIGQNQIVKIYYLNETTFVVVPMFETSNSTVWVIDPVTGNDTNSGHSPFQALKTLDKANTLVNNNDSVMFWGFYAENNPVTINKNITLTTNSIVYFNSTVTFTSGCTVGHGFMFQATNTPSVICTSGLVKMDAPWLGSNFSDVYEGPAVTGSVIVEGGNLQVTNPTLNQQASVIEGAMTRLASFYLPQSTDPFGITLTLEGVLFYQYKDTNGLSYGLMHCEDDHIETAVVINGANVLDASFQTDATISDLVSIGTGVKCSPVVNNINYSCPQDASSTAIQRWANSDNAAAGSSIIINGITVDFGTLSDDQIYLSNATSANDTVYINNGLMQTSAPLSSPLVATGDGNNYYSYRDVSNILFENPNEQLNTGSYSATYTAADFSAGVLTILPATHGLGAIQGILVDVKDPAGNDLLADNAVSSTGVVTITGENGTGFNCIVTLISGGSTDANGSVTSVGLVSSSLTVTGSPITSSGTITVNLPNTAVTPGSYTLANITIDAKGRITAAANGSETGTGTVTSVGMTSTTLTVSGGPINNSGTFTVNLSTSGASAGTYVNPSITVDTYGRVTNISSGAGAQLITIPNVMFDINGGYAVPLPTLSAGQVFVPIQVSAFIDSTSGAPTTPPELELYDSSLVDIMPNQVLTGVGAGGGWTYTIANGATLFATSSSSWLINLTKGNTTLPARLTGRIMIYGYIA